MGCTVLKTWEEIVPGFPERPYGIPSLLRFGDTGRFWIASWDKLYASEDNGATWTLALTTPDRAWINTLLETPDGALWVGHAKGLLSSVDGGQTWQAVGGTLDGADFLDLAWDERNETIWAGLHQRGVYGSTLGEQQVAREAPAGVLSQPLAPGSYPNPFTQSTTIHFDLARGGRVRLAVYDVLGREVARLVDQPLPAGAHRFPFDGSALAPGAYFYRVETEGGTESGVLVRAR